MGGGVTKHARRPTNSSSRKTVNLSDSILRGHANVAMDILEKNPELLNAEICGDGMRALHMACQAGQVEIVKDLVARGASLDEKNGEGATALMFAAAGGFDKICKLLLDAGADVRIGDAQSRNALQYAQLHSRTKVENLLQMYACEFTW